MLAGATAWAGDISLDRKGIKALLDGKGEFDLRERCESSGAKPAPPKRAAGDAPEGRQPLLLAFGSPIGGRSRGIRVGEDIGSAQQPFCDKYVVIDAPVVLRERELRQLLALEHLRYVEPDCLLPKPPPPYEEAAKAAPRVALASHDPTTAWWYRHVNAAAAGSGTDEDLRIVVAVIDDGVRLDHEHLQGHFWENAIEAAGTAGKDDDGNGLIDDVRGWDFMDERSEPLDPAASVHGTRVAGVIVQTVAARDRHVRIMPLRAWPTADETSMTSVARALCYAIDEEASVINMSMHWRDRGSRKTIEELIDLAASEDVVIAAAAGNERMELKEDAGDPGEGTSYPAAYGLTHENVLTVQGFGTPDLPFCGSNFASGVKFIAAPAREIATTDAASSTAWVTDFSHTSAAAPIVAGAAALIRTNPALTDIHPADALARAVIDEARLYAAHSEVPCQKSTNNFLSLDLGFLCKLRGGC